MKPELFLFEGERRLSEISFESVPIGTKAIKTITIRNSGDVDLKQIFISIDHADLKITKYPKFLNAGKSDDLIIEYTPIIETEKGIRTKINIKAIYVV